MNSIFFIQPCIPREKTLFSTARLYIKEMHERKEKKNKVKIQYLRQWWKPNTKVPVLSVYIKSATKRTL